MLLLLSVPGLFFVILWIIFYTFVKLRHRTARIVVSAALALLVTALLGYGVMSWIGSMGRMGC